VVRPEGSYDTEPSPWTAKRETKLLAAYKDAFLQGRVKV